MKHPLALPFLFLSLLSFDAALTAADCCRHIPLTNKYYCSMVHNQSPWTMRYTLRGHENMRTDKTPNLCAFWDWSGKLPEPAHKETVWCKQELLGRDGSMGGGSKHIDVDGFTFADRPYLWGKRFDVITRGVWTQIHAGQTVTCTGGGGTKGDMPVCKLD